MCLIKNTDLGPNFRPLGSLQLVIFHSIHPSSAHPRPQRMPWRWVVACTMCPLPWKPKVLRDLQPPWCKQQQQQEHHQQQQKKQFTTTNDKQANNQKPTTSSINQLQHQPTSTSINQHPLISAENCRWVVPFQLDYMVLWPSLNSICSTLLEDLPTITPITPVIYPIYLSNIPKWQKSCPYIDHT